MMESDRKIIRILLVDDHALFRESVSRVLAAEPDIRIVHCASIREALQLLAQQSYDLVLLDHDLGSERASQFLPAARQTGFDGKVLVVTAWVSDTEGRRLMRQGVSGIFLKEGPLGLLIESIRTVAAGGTWLDRSFAPLEGQQAEEPPATAVFNERQRKVLRFVLEGLSNKEIAWQLQISESYVKSILQSLFHKTGVRTRGQLVRVAFEQYEDQL
jgi:two-component system nitrate/nitrite response regulator NarL